VFWAHPVYYTDNDSGEMRIKDVEMGRSNVGTGDKFLGAG